MIDWYRRTGLRHWADRVCRSPGKILGLSLLLTVLSIVLTASFLEVHANRNDLVSDALEWNQRFERWTRQFPGFGDMLAVVDTYGEDDQPDPRRLARAEAFVAELGPRLAGLPEIEHVVWGFDPRTVHPSGVRLLPYERFDERVSRVTESTPLLTSETPAALLGAIVREAGASLRGGDRGEAEAIEAVSHLRGLMAAFEAALRTDPTEAVDLGANLGPDTGGAWQFLSSPNGRFLFVIITPRRDVASNGEIAGAIERTRRVMAEVGGDRPELDFGLTGIDVIEADETKAFMADAIKASLIAAVLIGGVLVLAFHNVRTPLLLMVSLGIGIAWSFGLLTLVIGHLQVISSVFAVILLGLGVCFGVHLATRFESRRHDHGPGAFGFKQTLRDTLVNTGPGLMTGAITTAVAFFTLWLTYFTGAAEMGLIASLGVLACLVAMFTVFPALLRLFKSELHHVPPVHERRLHIFEDRWVRPFYRHPRPTLWATGGLTVLSLLAASQMRYDHNLLALLPDHLESDIWQNRLAEQGGQSIYFGVSIVDSVAEGRALAQRYRALDSVGSLGGLGWLMPEDDAAKLDRLAELRSAIRGPLDAAIRAFDAYNNGRRSPPDEPDHLARQAGAVVSLIDLAGGAAQGALARELEQLRETAASLQRTINNLPPEAAGPAMAALQADYARWRFDRVNRIQEMLAPRALQIDDFPDAVTRSFTSIQRDPTRYMLEIYPQLPPGVSDPLDPAFLPGFIADLREIDPEVTGVIVQVFESGTLIWQSMLFAGVVALVAVYALVWVDFRSWLDSALVLLPVVLGFSFTMALLWLIGGRINTANIIVLPLMFGLGVDSGVHILHRYRLDWETRPLGLSGGTGKAISLTGYMTVIGFGSLLVAGHRGMQSLGLALALGIGLTTLACWIVMPAILELRRRPPVQAHLAYRES